MKNCEFCDTEDAFTLYGVCFECIQRLIIREREDRSRGKRFAAIYEKEVLGKKHEA